MSHLPESTLKHLLVKISQGDTQAFARIYQTYHDDVFRFVMHMRADRADADEVVNDVFLHWVRTHWGSRATHHLRAGC